MIHSFGEKAGEITPPERFTYPFCYEPHPLARLAAESLRAKLHRLAESDVRWREELAAGKMFGVLVVRDRRGGLGYLAAFSGNLLGTNCHEGFVPPVYDMLRPEDWFRTEEAAISAINHRIEALESGAEPKRLREELAAAECLATEEIAKAKRAAAQARQARAERRAHGEDEAVLMAESQYEKAELRRLKLRHKAITDGLAGALKTFEEEIDSLKAERARRSVELQIWLFGRFRMLNARGEERDLCEIFAATPQRVPPAGAGECAAPKLLQYAYLNGLTPIAMAEFWQGRSPRGEVRRDGEFYPSCRGKCLPILTFMLQGVEVDPDPMERVQSPDPEVVWEDEHIVAVDKPCGMLSVDGLTAARSVEGWARERYGADTFVRPAHRLDQATSGILLIAKSLEIYKALQAQFAGRSVRKRYIALLEGVPERSKGRISLPIKADYDNRPRQMVADDGAEAVTYYEVVPSSENIDTKCFTRVYFYPLTGRTHQLRLHAAHAEGLGAAIVGDSLYGHAGGRLCLHAEHVEFTHPVTGERIFITSKPDF